MYENYFNIKENGSRKEKKSLTSPTIPIMRTRIMEERENGSAQELGEQLEVFANGTLNIFSREQSTSESNRFTVYGLSELGKRMRAMAMLVMLESITSRIKYNQASGVATWVYIDEIHELWDDEYSLLAVQRKWREVRKLGGICTGMTQNIIDGTRNREIQTMVSNSEFTTLLDQGVMDRQTVEQLFEVSETQIGYVNGAKKGGGLILSLIHI